MKGSSVQNVLRSAVVATALLAGAVAAPAAGAAAAPIRPNIVYIICDDLGIGDVQCYNRARGKIPTPCIDKLAGQGMLFTDCHGGSSVCTPTRYGVLTGRYAWRTRLQAGVLDGGDDPPLIAAGRMTVGSLLQSQGYATAAVGKWHLGFLSRIEARDPASQPAAVKKKAKKQGRGGLPVGAQIIDGPVTRGFDTFFGFSNARTISALIENDRVVDSPEPVAMLPRLTERAVQYIGRHAAGASPGPDAGKPFFLYFALNSPHTPIVPSKEWEGKSGLGKYGDYVMESDWAVGQVLAAIEKAGLEKDTLVFFTSDNGCSPAAGVPHLEKEGHFPSAQYRGYKADIWDGGHRIPFIARWPGRIKEGATCDRLVCLTDLLATCAEIAGVRLPDTAGEDSVSLLPALLGRSEGPWHEAVVHHSISGRFSIRQGNWKLELCAGSGGWGKPGEKEAKAQGLPAIQLYDMSKDVSERQNVQAQHKDVVQNLTRLLEKYIADGRSAPGAPQKNDARIDMRKGTGPQADDTPGDGQ